LAATSAPPRVSRTMPAAAGGRGSTGSSIVFDRSEGRFVNSNSARAGDSGQGAAAAAGDAAKGNTGMKVYPAHSRGGNDPRVPPAGDRMNAREGGRQFAPAARNSPPPPNVPHSVTSERVSNQVNAGGGRGAGPAGAGASGGASRGAAPSGGAGASSAG